MTVHAIRVATNNINSDIFYDAYKIFKNVQSVVHTAANTYMFIFSDGTEAKSVPADEYMINVIGYATANPLSAGDLSPASEDNSGQSGEVDDGESGEVNNGESDEVNDGEDGEDDGEDETQNSEVNGNE